MSTAPQKNKYHVNLPKTSFAMKASLATREPERLQQWSDEGLEQRLRVRHANASQTFLLHDGPPYANGHIHIGHALNKILKDMIVRSKAQQGYHVRYVPGWDCHGLPIEQALLKEQGKRKDQVDQLAFRQDARVYAQRFIDVQRQEFTRLGIRGEWEQPYLTMDTTYQASIAASFYALYNKGYIYRGEKPVYWSTGAETALAEAELEYQDKTSDAIYVTLPIPADAVTDARLGDAAQLALMIWTTTPWTLPANVGAAVHPELTYGVYEIAGSSARVWIVATALIDRVCERLGVTVATCRTTCTGTELQLWISAYQHPFIDRRGTLILADYVSDTDGTGIVHIAPGHGEDDYVYGHLRNGLDIVSPVDHAGRFTEDFGDVRVKGHDVFAANAIIMAHLQAIGCLQGQESHQHSYPFCWRTKTPVIVRSTPQWFLRMDHEGLRSRVLDMIHDAHQIAWYPPWGEQRIGTMVEGRPDWCLSRQRLWGVPIPVARHKETGEVHCTPALQQRVLDVFRAEGTDAWFQHPIAYFLQDVSDVDAYELETDMLDVWFDSGVSHQAVLAQREGLTYPCDLYVEGSDQHRGWFQSSLITSVAMHDRPPFAQVLTHGFVVDGQGKKMSKSLGNVVKPQEVLQQYGADVLRLWVASCDTDTDVRMSSDIVEQMAESYRKIRNTFRYMLGNLSDFDPARHMVPMDQLGTIDAWMLQRMARVASAVQQHYDRYRFHAIYHAIHEICIMDLSAFYLDVLKDRLYCDQPDDPQRRSAQTALYLVTQLLCQLLAPILVFTMDEVWQSFTFGDTASVHEATWNLQLEQLYPEHERIASEQIWETIRKIRRIADGAIEQLRSQGAVGSSLECQVVVSSVTPELQQWLESHQAELTAGLIVSAVSGVAQESTVMMTGDVEWPADDRIRAGTISVGVSRVAAQKCGRCWKRLADVGTLADPLLCGRCHAAEEQYRTSVSAEAK
jgi:isoleucyl-tRNA synthetase